MTVEQISARLRARLQEEYGVDEAAILMDRPPGGWADLVTNASLDRRFTDFEARIDAKFDAKFEALDYRFEALEHKIEASLQREIRSQTWRLMTATIAAMSGLVGAMGIFVAIATTR
jgi:hypothetical protein